ncbi:MAG: MAPEG family protein [Burkholderiaceae bacterium]
MRTELWILAAAAVLGLVHLTAASFAFKAQVGNRYTVGPRDQNIQPVGIAGRLQRAQQNFLETFSIFAVFVVLVHLTNAHGALSHWGAILYLAGRILFLPLYAWGVTWLRTLSWNLATLGLALVGVQFLLGNT